MRPIRFDGSHTGRVLGSILGVNRLPGSRRALGDQQARNLVIQLGDEHPFRFLVHDRDTKFTHAFNEIFRTEGIGYSVGISSAD
jgi:hypothetical protein